VGYENEVNERGERLIWLDHAVVARLRAMRGPGASYSDVTLRLAAGSAANEAGEAITAPTWRSSLRAAAFTGEVLSG
jgi:hypothetical protein